MRLDSRSRPSCSEPVHPDLAALLLEGADDIVSDAVAQGGNEIPRYLYPRSRSMSRSRFMSRQPASVSTSWVRTSAHGTGLPSGQRSRNGTGPSARSLTRLNNHE